MISSTTFSSEECGYDQEYENQGFFAFYPDGNYYQKSTMSATKILVGFWEWENNSKSEIFISNQTGSGIMTVTSLNDDNIVFGNEVSVEGCSVTNYEQFNNPSFYSSNQLFIRVTKLIYLEIGLWKNNLTLAMMQRELF